MPDCCLDNKNLSLEDGSKAPGEGRKQLRQLDGTPQKRSHGGHRSVGDPAGNDRGEVLHLGVRIQGEPMGGDPSRRNPHTDGSQLPLGYPDTCQTFLTPGKDPELFSRLYEYDPGMVREVIARFFELRYTPPRPVDIKEDPEAEGTGAHFSRKYRIDKGRVRKSLERNVLWNASSCLQSAREIPRRIAPA